MYAWLDTKPCSLCHAEKPLDQFYRRTRSRDGRQAACIPCTRSALDTADERRRAARQAAATTPPAPARPARPRRPAAYRPAANAWERSTGRPRLMRPARIVEFEDLAQALAADAQRVALALYDVADEGNLTPLWTLVELLCEGRDCMGPEDDDEFEDWEPPDCLLHDLADIHEGQLVERYPSLKPLVWPSTAAPEAAHPALSPITDAGA